MFYSIIEILEHLLDKEAPKNRSECLCMKKPCPWVRCRYHMIWAIIDRDCKYNFKHRHMRGDILESYTDDEIIDIICSMKESCVLDVADKGKHTLDQIGKLVGLSSQRIQAMERGIGPVKGYIDRMKITAAILDSIPVLQHRLLGDAVREVQPKRQERSA
jgi:hypothetical protein